MKRVIFTVMNSVYFSVFEHVFTLCFPLLLCERLNTSLFRGKRTLPTWCSSNECQLSSDMLCYLSCFYAGGALVSFPLPGMWSVWTVGQGWLFHPCLKPSIALPSYFQGTLGSSFKAIGLDACTCYCYIYPKSIFEYVCSKVEGCHMNPRLDPLSLPHDKIIKVLGFIHAPPPLLPPTLTKEVTITSAWKHEEWAACMSFIPVMWWELFLLLPWSLMNWLWEWGTDLSYYCYCF